MVVLTQQQQQVEAVPLVVHWAHQPWQVLGCACRTAAAWMFLSWLCCPTRSE